jgi:hypothetical protein
MAVKFIVTHGYVQYGNHRKLPRRGECELCNAVRPLIFEHCHLHGWIRGMACQPCNGLLRAAEAGTCIVPRQAGHLANCPECPRAGTWLARVPKSECVTGCLDGLLWVGYLGRFMPCPACPAGGDRR